MKSYDEALNSKDLAKSMTKKMAISDRSCVIFDLLKESTDNLLNGLAYKGNDQPLGPDPPYRLYNL